MNVYPFDRTLSSESDMLDFFAAAIRYRNEHKEDSARIATHVFDKTHRELQPLFSVSDDIDNIRFEFGALEAPGMPEGDEISLNEYDDKLWNRLNNLVTKIKEKQTV